MARLTGSRTLVLLSLALWQPWPVLREAWWQVALGVALGLPLALTRHPPECEPALRRASHRSGDAGAGGPGDVDGGWCGELLPGAAGDEGGPDDRASL